MFQLVGLSDYQLCGRSRSFHSDNGLRTRTPGTWSPLVHAGKTCTDVIASSGMEVHSVEAIVRALNEANVRYLIVEGLAVNAHGFVRLTRAVDIVLALDPENAASGLHALLAIGYQLAIPATPEQFAHAETRENWRATKQMIVLKLWSDQHRRTPVDIFVYEPFDFDDESRAASALEICAGVSAPVVSIGTLIEMKRAAARPQDLIDIEELQRLR